MTFEAARKNIEQRWADNWLYSAYVFDNRPAPEGEEVWVRLTILDGDTEQASIGGPTSLYRHFGIIAVQVFVKEQTGTAKARQLADTVASIFRGQKFNGILCRSPAVQRVGVIEGWFQINVNVPFQWDGSF